jgi:hypothetical protein
MAVEVEKTGTAIGFLDPEFFNFTMLTIKAHAIDFTVS